MRKHSVVFILFLALGTSVLPVLAQTLVLKNIGAVTPVAWGDYDNDNDVDLLQYNGSSFRILKNNRDGTTAICLDAGMGALDLNPASGYVGNKKLTENSSY